jgi:hypothetical protein
MLLASLALASVSIATNASAATVPGFDGSLLTTCDDCFTAAVPLGFTVNFFGVERTQTFVSANGYLTFDSGQGEYTPEGLGAGYSGQPIIAAFYADFDTREGGATRYGTGTFDGRNAFGVTYANVGVYGGSTDDKRNTVQLLLVDRGDTGMGNFDIVFNYDQIEWETGSASGGSNGLGGTSAAVGYNAGTGNAPGTFYELPGSRTPGSFLDGGPLALVSNSNVGVPGRLIFNVRGGVVSVPDAVPEPASWAMMIGGFGLIGGALRRRVRTSVSFA